MDRWQRMSAAALGRDIAKGSIDPVDLTEAFLDAIADHPDAPRIYARPTPARARAEAKAASDRAKAGQRLSPLDGVPVSWKDLFDSGGTETEAGSQLLKGRVPDQDATVLRNATALGMVCLGKTHMSELAFSGLGVNPMTATPPCVNDPKAAPGGSSSGAAASVGFGLAAIGMGSDTGGSVRIPAAWNDLVGFKTSHGVVSNDGVVPLCPQFDTIGPLCRSVEDAALSFAAITGTKPVPVQGERIESRRFAICTNAALEDLDPAPSEAFFDAVARLEKAGAIIEEVDVPEVSAALLLSPTLYPTEAYGVWKKTIEAAPEKMFHEILERFRAGDKTSGPDYIAAWQALFSYRTAWTKQTAHFDAVILPTSPILPPDVARLQSDSAYYVRSNLLALRNTRIGNFMDQAVVTLPTGHPSSGISFMKAPGTEAALLRIAAAAEVALA